MKKLILPLVCASAVLSGCDTMTSALNEATTTLGQLPKISVPGTSGNACTVDDQGQPIPKEDCKHWAFYKGIQNGMRDAEMVHRKHQYGIAIASSRSTPSKEIIERPSMGLIQIHYEFKGGDKLVVHKKWENL